MLWKEQVAVFGNFSTSAVRLGGEEEKKASPHKSSQPCKLRSTKARSLVRSREAGLLRGAPRVLRGLRAAPRAPGAAAAHPAPGHRVPAGAQGWRLVHPGLPHYPDCTAPAETPRRRGSGFVSAPEPCPQPRPPAWQEPGPCSPVRPQRSKARRAAAPALGIPAAAPAAVAAPSTVWDARGRALRFVAYSWGRHNGWGLGGRKMCPPRLRGHWQPMPSLHAPRRPPPRLRSMGAASPAWVLPQSGVLGPLQRPPALLLLSQQGFCGSSSTGKRPFSLADPEFLWSWFGARRESWRLQDVPCGKGMTQPWL